MVSNTDVERTIHFYAIDIGRDDGGKRFPFDPTPLLKAIECLDFRRDGSPSRYESAGVGDDMLCAVFEPPGSWDALKFCRVRSSGLPELEERGQIRSLELKDDERLVESCHAVFFRGNILGFELNRDGPRAGQLGWYLEARSEDFRRPIQFRHLVRSDPAGRLVHFTDLVELEIEIHRPYLEIVRNAHPSLGGVLDAQEEAVGGGNTIRAKLTFPGNIREGGLAKYRRVLADLARRPDVSDGFRHFRARGTRGDTGHLDTINLLGDQIIVRKKILRLNEHGRAVDSASAFQGIREAYSELETEIQSASSVVLR